MKLLMCVFTVVSMAVLSCQDAPTGGVKSAGDGANQQIDRGELNEPVPTRKIPEGKYYMHANGKRNRRLL